MLINALFIFRILKFYQTISATLKGPFSAKHRFTSPVRRHLCLRLLFFLIIVFWTWNFVLNFFETRRAQKTRFWKKQTLASCRIYAIKINVNPKFKHFTLKFTKKTTPKWGDFCNIMWKFVNLPVSVASKTLFFELYGFQKGLVQSFKFRKQLFQKIK